MAQRPSCFSLKINTGFNAEENAGRVHVSYSNTEGLCRSSIEMRCFLTSLQAEKLTLKLHEHTQTQRCRSHYFEGNFKFNVDFCGAKGGARNDVH